jgi:hypothetical protein
MRKLKLKRVRGGSKLKMKRVRKGSMCTLLRRILLHPMGCT